MTNEFASSYTCLWYLFQYYPIGLRKQSICFCFSSFHIFRTPPPNLFVLSCPIGVIANNVMFCVCRGEAICVFHVWHEVFPALPPGETQTHSYGYGSIHRTLFKLIQLWDSVVLQIALWDCTPWLLAAYLFYVTTLHTAIIATHSLTAGSALPLMVEVEGLFKARFGYS